MANINSLFGFRSVKKVGAGYNASAQNEYVIASNETSAIFQGDPVVLNANGSISVGSTKGAELIGVFNGCFYTDPTTQKPTYSNYYPGAIVADDIVANVIDDPNVVFSIDSDGAFAVADIFKNFAITNVTGNTLTGISEVQLDHSVSGLTTSGTVLQAIDISQDTQNDTAGSANVDVLVRINNHFYSQGTGL